MIPGVPSRWALGHRRHALNTSRGISICAFLPQTLYHRRAAHGVRIHGSSHLRKDSFARARYGGTKTSLVTKSLGRNATYIFHVPEQRDICARDRGSSTDPQA